MLTQLTTRIAKAVIATAFVVALLSSMTSEAHARFVYWAAGGGGFWDVNDNWLPLILPDGYAIQPFDNDDVSIPAGGLPTVRFLEGISTLDVEPTAGITNNSVLGVHNGVVNDGFIKMSGDAQFGIDAGGLSGAGEVVLADSTGTYAAVTGAPHPFACCVTQAATHTIRGEGTVQGKWINDGLIRAEETSGDSTAELVITGTMTNNGIIRSSATAHIYAVSLDLTLGATGQFIADTQNIDLGVATITGGTITAINGARFVRRDAGGTTVFSGVTINGDFDVLVTNAGIAGTGTGITNNGTITLDNLGVANGQFHMDAGSTLGGTGTVILNRANSTTRLTGNFTQGASHTIRGAGLIQATIINNGTMIAEPKINGGLLRYVNNSMSNNNVVQANDGGTFRFEQEAAITQSAAGRIRAVNGGLVEFINNVSVTGGKLQTEGTGVIVTPAGNASILVDVTNGGAFHTAASATTRVRGAMLENNGTMTVNPTAANALTTMEFGSSLTLSGTGSIVLNQVGNSARMTFLTGAEVVTQAAGHTIRGRGIIDNGFGSGRLVNNGRLEGASAAEPLAVFSRLSGAGTLKDVAIGGGFIQIQHILGEAGTTAIVPAEGLYGFGRNSSLLVDLAGTTPGTGYDQLSSTGAITLSSTATRLEVSLAGGFLPMPGQSFTLLTTTGSLTGNFGTVALPTLAPGLAWTQTQTATSFSIGVTGSLAADFDEDGDVDKDDLTRWQAGYGTGTLHAQGNADGDGDVDGADFLAWQRSVGWGVSATAAPTGVPEPDAALLALAALVVRSVLSKSRRGGFHRRGRGDRRDQFLEVCLLTAVGRPSP